MDGLHHSISKSAKKLDVQTALTFTETENFHPIKVQMMNKDTKEALDIECGNAVGTSDKSMVEKALLRFNISDVAYHELAQINPTLPRQSQLTKVSKGMNTAYNVWPTPGQTKGVQQSIVDRLKIRLQHILKNNPSFALRKSIRVKITGDGAVVSRSLHFLVVAFSIVDVKEENTNPPSGNHIVALLNTTEDYDNMTEAMENVVQDIKTLKSISVNGITFSVEFFLGADWKFLALVEGVNSASSKYFCIWCKCSNEARHIIGDWSIDNPFSQET